MPSTRGISRFALGLLALGASSSCQSHDRAPPPVPSTTGGSSGSGLDGGILIDGKVTDGPPVCGGQTLQAITHPPLLYFVIDRSGSMGSPIDSSTVSKYSAARLAIGKLLDAIGARVRYGAAIYPATDNDSDCQAGFQMFPPVLGDAPSTVTGGSRGPILRELMNRLSGYKPGGATPTAATLGKLAPIIAGYREGDDPTFVMLVTDGAPNCNFAAKCGVADCIPHIEAAATGLGAPCGPDVNCCDTSIDPRAGANCIDADASEAAVVALRETQIRTFVIGMPGSEAYARTLNRLAVAGGTARAGSPSYYAVSDSAALSAALLGDRHVGCHNVRRRARAAPDRPQFGQRLLRRGTGATKSRKRLGLPRRSCARARWRRLQNLAVGRGSRSSDSVRLPNHRALSRSVL
ncbi:MAG: vWA domain-containing protein [Polyangiaceae bacterium]